jgi:hypothetical protein
MNRLQKRATTTEQVVKLKCWYWWTVSCDANIMLEKILEVLL